LSATFVPERYLRMRKLREIYVPVTPPTLWKWVKQGRFPRPIQLNPGVVNSPIVWSEAEILEWLATRPRGFGIGMPQVTARRVQVARNRREGRTPRYGFRRGHRQEGDAP
jgi:predicted DNA-binding transcriptional regulator AlpA